jgi:hypothetical protein
MSCGKCAGSQVGKSFLGWIGEIIFCEQYRAFFYEGAKYCIAVTTAAVAGIYTYFLTGNQTEKSIMKDDIETSIKLNGIDCLPFATSLAEAENQEDMNIVTSQSVMEGSYGNDIMLADEKGSKMFADGGLNYMIASPAEDEFSFSLCGIKIEDKTLEVITITNVIEGFNPIQDKIKFFCMEHNLEPANFEILHDSINGMDMTYIYIHVVDKAVHEEDDDAFIALVGNLEINSSDFVLNEAWEFCSAA